jgi:hypothetical protein
MIENGIDVPFFNRVLDPFLIGYSVWLLDA